MTKQLILVVEVNLNKRLAIIQVWSIKLTLNGGRNKCDNMKEW